MNKFIFTTKTFILHLYSPQKLAENPCMDSFAHPVTSVYHSILNCFIKRIEINLYP